MSSTIAHPGFARQTGERPVPIQPDPHAEPESDESHNKIKPVPLGVGMPPRRTADIEEDDIVSLLKQQVRLVADQGRVLESQGRLLESMAVKLSNGNGKGDMFTKAAAIISAIICVFVFFSDRFVSTGNAELKTTISQMQDRDRERRRLNERDKKMDAQWHADMTIFLRSHGMKDAPSPPAYTKDEEEK